MSSFTKEEYLKLCRDLLQDQYGDDGIEDYIKPEAWMPAESDLKQKLSNPNNNGITDLSSSKKDKIIEAIHKCSNVKVFNFIIKITSYHCQKDTNGPFTSVNITIYETKREKHLGIHKNLLSKINPNKDTRFENRSWLSYFNTFESGINIPIEEIPDIVRWLQAISKLEAFI